MRPPLSIVIPSHNRADLLQVCLESVRQYAPKGTEILVVDDASPDARVRHTALQFDGVAVLRLEQPSGFCVAANRGMQAAQANVVELLNDDTQVSPGWAGTALNHFEEPAIGAVAPLVLSGSPTDETPFVDSAGDRYFAGGIATKRGHGQPLGPSFLQGGEVFGASASSAFYRRDLVLRLGGFPEHFGAYFEDVDLAFRLHWAGARVLYEPRSRVWHRVSASYGEPAAALLERQSRNEELVFWRNLPSAQLLSALPTHVAVVAGKAWRRWREGQLTPFLRGRWRALAQARDIVRHRQRLSLLGEERNNNRWGIETHYWE